MLYRTVFALWLKFYSTDLDRGKISKTGGDVKNHYFLALAFSITKN